MAKRKFDVGKLITRIIACLLALLMVLGMGATFIYYIVAM